MILNFLVIFILAKGEQKLLDKYRNKAERLEKQLHTIAEEFNSEYRSGISTHQERVDAIKRADELIQEEEREKEEQRKRLRQEKADKERQKAELQEMQWKAKKEKEQKEKREKEEKGQNQKEDKAKKDEKPENEQVCIYFPS